MKDNDDDDDDDNKNNNDDDGDGGKFSTCAEHSNRDYGMYICRIM